MTRFRTRSAAAVLALALGCAGGGDVEAPGSPGSGSPIDGGSGPPGAYDLPEVALDGTPVALAWVHPSENPALPPYWYTVWSSGWAEPQRLVIRTQAEWEAAWATTFASQTERPPLPAVDFSQEVVLLAATGLRPSGVPSLFLRNAAARGGRVTVGVVELTTGPRCATAAVVVSVTAIARMARPPGEITFVSSPIVRDCG